MVRACCASPRSFTVVVLMRDESGYMMLLLLLPFHQQRKPTNTQPTQTWYRGIPHRQQHPAFANVETENRDLLAVYSWLRVKAQDPLLTAPALDAFYCSSSSRSGLT